MEPFLQNIAESLESAAKQYQAIINSQGFHYNSWEKNVILLSPIVTQLMEEANSKVLICEEELGLVNQKQTDALLKRSALYERQISDKEQLSRLDRERIRIISEINQLSQEISSKEVKIADLQEQIAKAKKDNEYWNTVFWATCWIPFANIGTGVKKHTEDGHYYAAVKVLGEEIKVIRERISTLNNDLKSSAIQQSINHESSGKLANQITAVEGEIAAVTTLINDLRKEAGLWRAILSACLEIKVQLEYTNGKIKPVMECFDRLVEITNLLDLPTTRRYINGCLNKGEKLSAGQKLCQNEYLLSQNHRFAAVMQANNNFVVYNSEKPLWASNTWNASGTGYIVLDEDGLFSLKGIDGSWNTKRKGAAELIMQNDGSLAAYDKDNQPLWSSDTYTYSNVYGICFSIT